MTTPWIEAFKIPADDRRLSELLRVRPAPLNLAGMSATTAWRVIDDALKRMFGPSKQDLRIIRKIIDIFAAHASTYYADLAQYRRDARGRPPLLIDPPMIMFTGPAGVGKSQLAAALDRLLCVREPVKVDEDLGPFHHRPVVRVEVESNLSGSDMLNIIADSLGLQHQYGRKTKNDAAHLRLRLYQRGCCGIIPDEMQWLSRSDTSNAHAAKVLTQLAELRLPCLYVCNYSLGHKLARRPPEDVARFLSAPIIMLPEPFDSEDFSRHMADVQSLFPEATFDIVPEQDSEEFHDMSFGLRRMVGRLYAFGYGRAVEERGGKRGEVRVTMDHIRKVYESSDYEEDRKTVERSFSALSGIETERRDYICPFELPPSDEARMRKEADHWRQRRLNAAEALASRSGAEKTADKEAKKHRVKEQRARSSNLETNRPTPRAPKIRTASDLLAGL